MNLYSDTRGGFENKFKNKHQINFLEIKEFIFGICKFFLTSDTMKWKNEEKKLRGKGNIHLEILHLKIINLRINTIVTL